MWPVLAYIHVAGINIVGPMDTGMEEKTDAISVIWMGMGKRGEEEEGEKRRGGGGQISKGPEWVEDGETR